MAFLVEVLPRLEVSLILTLLVTWGMASILAVCIYRLKFHPLSRHPGPLLAKLTSAYGAYHGYKGDMHLDILRCHLQYGDFVRYGPNKVVVNSSEGVQDIYGFAKPIKKSTAYLPMVPWKDGFATITAVDKATHRRMRGALSNALSPDALKRFEPAVSRTLDMFCQRLGEGPGVDGWTTAKNMNELDQYLMVETMAELFFGRSIGLLDNPESRFIIPIFNFYAFRMGLLEQWPWLAKLGIESSLNALSQVFETQKRFAKWRTEFIDSIWKPSNMNRGIFSSILEGNSNPKAKAQGYSYTMPELMAEGSFLLLVGGDSSAAIMSALLFYLTRYPTVRHRLTQEVRDTFSSIEEISTANPSLAACAYLHACISETMRISPSTPGVPWREVEAPGVLIRHAINGTNGLKKGQSDSEFIPSGTDVGTCIYALHHRADIFEKPTTFWPERWLPGTLDEQDLARAKQAFKPFSIGTRSCAGRSVALMELSLTVARVLWEFDIARADGPLGDVGGGGVKSEWGREEEMEFQFETHFTAMSEGPWVTFRRRI